MNMGERIQYMRKQMGMTQEELGAKIGVQKAAIYKYEAGKVKNIKRSSIEIMSKLFGVSPTWLMGLEDQTPDKNLIASQVIVIEQIQKCFGNKMVELLSYANELNEEGLNQALNQIEQLTEIKRFQKEGVMKKE